MDLSRQGGARSAIPCGLRRGGIARAPIHAPGKRVGPVARPLQTPALPPASAPGPAAADASFIAAGGYLPSVNKLFGCMESIDDRAQGTAISVVEIATSGLPVHRATLGLGDSIKIFRRV